MISVYQMCEARQTSTEDSHSFFVSEMDLCAWNRHDALFEYFVQSRLVEA